MNAKKSEIEFKAVSVHFPDDSVVCEAGTGEFLSRRYSRAYDN